MGYRLKQVSGVLVALLLVTMLLVFLKRRSDALAKPRSCPTQSLLSSNKRFQNGYIGKQKCCDAVDGKSLEAVCGYNGKSTEPIETPEGPAGCSCMDYFYCKVVVASSVSSNHLHEAAGMIISIQKCMPNTRLIMYSLGLTHEEMDTLRAYCNVELRTFDFDKYGPKLAYSKNHLRSFGWKPAVVKEVSDEYEVLMYFDSSVRLTGPVGRDVLKYLWSSPAFIAGPWFGKGCSHMGMPIVSFTHNSMLEYLFPNKSSHISTLRKELSVWGHLQAGVWIMWLNNEMRRKILDTWLDCAFHQECMAPKKANIDGCATNLAFKTAPPNGGYTGCHRYDQSALNLIFYREFGTSAADTICHKFVFKLLLVQRESNVLFYLFLLAITITILVIILVNYFCN